jgi:phage/plasmid primase-like uncharacterized protein
VAKALHEKFPDKPIIIAGDDADLVDGNNPGREKAEAAAGRGRQGIFPIFAPAESLPGPTASRTEQRRRAKAEEGAGAQIAALHVKQHTGRQGWASRASRSSSARRAARIESKNPAKVAELHIRPRGFPP